VLAGNTDTSAVMQLAHEEQAVADGAHGAKTNDVGAIHVLTRLIPDGSTTYRTSNDLAPVRMARRERRYNPRAAPRLRRCGIVQIG